METAPKTYKVGISGSYGGLNLGDEAILHSMITQLRQSLPIEFTIFSRNPDDTRTRYGIARAIAARKLSRDEIIPEIARLDLFILGGGGLLFDSEAKTFLREADLALELNVPVMVYAIGAGPLKDPTAQQAVRNVLNRAAAITVRERTAKHVLEEAGVRQDIRITADPAFLLAPEALPDNALQAEHLEEKQRVVAMSVREPGGAAPDLEKKDYVDLLSNAADFMVDRFDADIVFIPMEHEFQDVQYSHAVISRMYFAKRAQVLKEVYTPGQLLSLFPHFAFAVGMRLHFLIFAALQGVAFAALPYATKVTGILDMLGIEMPTLQVVTAGKLTAYIDRSWDHRQEVLSSIRKRLPALQQAARENNRIALELLKSAAVSIG